MIFRTLTVIAVLICVISVEGARKVHRGTNRKPVTTTTTALPPSGEGAPVPSRTRAVDAGDLVPSLKGFSCPGKTGRFPLKGECDKYIECEDGVPEEKTCPDGLLFNAFVPYADPCGYPIDVDCTGRENVQPPNPSEDCAHQFGYFRLGDAKNCGQFLNCASGNGYVLDCPEGLAFNSETYQCDWPDMVPECDAAAFLGFECPPAPFLRGLNGEEIEDTKLRTFRTDKSCQKYILCTHTGPRLLGCGSDFAYDEETGTCKDIDEVETCTPEPGKGRTIKTDDEPELDVRYGKQKSHEHARTTEAPKRRKIVKHRKIIRQVSRN